MPRFAADDEPWGSDRRHRIEASSHVGMLQDHARLLAWLDGTAVASSLRDHKIDRLIPRRDRFDLRIRVLDQDDGWRAMACQIVAAPAAQKNPLSLGAWDLVCRDPLNDPRIHVAGAIDRASHDRLALLLGADVTDSSLFAYTPDRRAVVRYRTTDGRTYFGKLYRSGRSERAFEWVMHLRESGLTGCLAEPVARIPELEMIVWRDVEGSLLGNEYPHAGYRNGLRLAGHALRKLHDASRSNDTDDQALDRRTLSDEWEVARAYVEQVNALTGTSSGELQDCSAELAGRMGAWEAFEPRTLHGDFHDNQVIVADSTATLLDLDQRVHGDPAIDVGNFLAHIDFRIAYAEADDDPKPYATAFLGGYGDVSDDSFQRRVLCSHAVSLLRNGCLYVLVPDRVRVLAGACRRAIKALEESRSG